MAKNKGKTVTGQSSPFCVKMFHEGRDKIGNISNRENEELYSIIQLSFQREKHES